MKSFLPANSLDFVPRKLRLQFSVSKSNNSEALLSVFFQDMLKVNRNFKKITFWVIKILIFQLSYRSNNLFLYLFPAYTSWQSLLGHLSCKHPFSSPLEPWLLHTCAATLRKMGTGARFQFHTQSVSYRKEGRKKRVTSTYILRKIGMCWMKKHTYRQLKQFLKNKTNTVTLNINFKYFFSH